MKAMGIFHFSRPRGARPPAGQPFGTGKGFNSRAREGRDIRDGDAGVLKLMVSIHAPARGATRIHLQGRY